MKRKLFCLVFFALTIISLSSCKVKNNSPSTNSEKIYGDGIVTYMAYDDHIKNGDYGSLLLDIYTKIALNDGTEVKYGENPNQAEHEIVLGDVQRQVAKDARALLDEHISKAISDLDDLDDEAEAKADIVGYSIYASGSSVAVVWSRPEIAEVAIQYFIDNYLSEPSLELKNGYIHSETLSYLEFLKAKDEEQKEKEWAMVETKLGSAVTKALKNHYSIFNEDFYYWLADLYDPVIGGFYFSNSARNNEGYLPDIESTAQVLSFLNESGMTASYGGYTYALGDEIGEAIVAFAKSLQSSQNGYFYHPQWVGLDYTASRLARDADWAGRVVNAYYNYFAEPYRKDLASQGFSTSEIEKKLKEIPELQKYMLLYDTPNGYKGLLGAPGVESVNSSEKKLTTRLRDSSVLAVSKVISVASNASRFTPQLRSLEAWTAYLYGGTVTDVVTGKAVKFEGFSIKNSDSYVTGNTISSQASQIKERDSVAKANGEPSGYAEITKKFFDDGVNPQNGIWGENVTYGSINGLMKIGQLYNSMGWELKYPDKAIESAVKLVLLEGEDEEGVKALASTYVYNPWVAIQYIFSNVSSYNKTINTSEFSSKYRKYITDNAKAMIEVTTQKTVQFARGDGSYGYYVTTPCTYSQGMPVAMPGVLEGDVNGATIACTGIITNMAKTLGIESITPSVYHSADMEKFIRRMNGLGDIIKDELITDVPPYTFEEEDLGICSGDMKNGERVVVDHNIPTLENAKMFSFTDSGNSTGSQTLFPAQGVLGTLAKSFVLDFDVYFEDINSASYIQLKIGQGASAAYMLTLDGNADGSVSLGDSSDTDSTVAVINSFGITIPAKEWHNIRLEYYPGTESTVKTKVYIDGVLKYISNNFYGKRSGESKTPGTTYSGVDMYSTNSSTLTVYLDNIIAQRCVDKWETEYIYNPDRIKDFEKNEIDGEMPAGLIASNSQIATDPLNSSNKVLKLPLAEGTVIANTTTRLNPASTFVFDTDLYVSDSEIGEIARIYMNSGSTVNSIYALSMQVIFDGEDNCIAFYPVTADGIVSNELLCKAPIGKWFNLRIEYYRYQYNDDYSEIQSIVYIGGKEACRSTCYYSFYNVAYPYKNLSFVKTALPATVYMDNIIAENDNIKFKDSDGQIIYDPASPTFPSGGNGSTAKPDEDYNGRLDFNDCETGVPKIPGLTTDPNSSEYGNSMEIAPSPEKENDNALLVNTRATVTSGKANMFSVIPYVSGDDANCAVLEWDMYMVSGLAPAYQIKIGDCFLFTINSSGELYVLTKQDEPTNGSGRRFYSMGLTLDFDKWHNIRVEYYHGTVETVKIKFYIDGKLRYECSDFAGKGTNVVGTPSGLYDDTHPAMFYSTRSSVASIYFDNIISEKIVKEYVPEEIWTPTPTVDTTGTRGEGLYANDENYKTKLETYESFTSAGNSTFKPGQWGWAKNWEKLLSDTQGKFLNIGKKNGELNPQPAFKVDTTEDITGKGYKLVFESDFMWGGTSEAMKGKQVGFIRFYSGSTVAHGINLYVTEDGSLNFNGATFAVKHWRNLRFEVLTSDGATYLVMYVDNEEVATTAVAASVKDADKVAIEIRLGSVLGVSGDDNYLDFSLDNTFVARIWDGTVVEPDEPSEPENPSGGDEKPEVTPPSTSEEGAEGGNPNDEDVKDDWIQT